MYGYHPIARLPETEAIMQKQSGNATALYHSVASKQTPGLFLDNQIRMLLCYARAQGLADFKLYADIGKSGLTLDRPALNALKADIEAGLVGKVMVCDIARIARNFMLCGAFVEWARARNVEIVGITGGAPIESHLADMAVLFRSLPKGGARA